MHLVFLYGTWAPRFLIQAIVSDICSSNLNNILFSTCLFIPNSLLLISGDVIGKSSLQKVCFENVCRAKIRSM